MSEKITAEAATLRWWERIPAELMKVFPLCCKGSAKMKGAKMNRIALMILKNLWKVPGAYGKLCHYAKHTERYSEEEKYAHIQYIMQCVVTSGNADLLVYGKENIPSTASASNCAMHEFFRNGP